MGRRGNFCHAPRSLVREKPIFKAELAVAVQHFGHVEEELLYLNKRMAFGRSEGEVKKNVVIILRRIVKFVEAANGIDRGLIVDAWCLIRTREGISLAYPAAFRFKVQSRFPNKIMHKGFSSLFQPEEDAAEIKQIIKVSQKRKLCRQRYPSNGKKYRRGRRKTSGDNGSECEN